MTIRIPIRSALLLTCGILLGIAVDRVGHVDALFPAVAAQQARGPQPAPTLESLAADVAQLKAIQPSNSHIMLPLLPLACPICPRYWPVLLNFRMKLS